MSGAIFRYGYLGSSITFDTNLKIRACFQADVLTNRNSRMLCGNVANHQACKKCQSTASRIHVIQCTGIETSIMDIDPEFKLLHSPCYNALDHAFQFLYHNSNIVSYDVCSKVYSCVFTNGTDFRFFAIDTWKIRKIPKTVD